MSRRAAVIDDDAAFAALIADALALRCWDTVLCLREEEVLACLEREPIDVALVDLRMSVSESGWRIVHLLDQHPQLRHRALIVGSADREQLPAATEWLRDQEIAVLEKPFDLEALYQAVEAAHDRRLAAHDR
jgi:DNA-binding NtrC family response regulator